MADPDYSSAEYLQRERTALRKFFGEFPFFKLMGFELIDVEPGLARLGMAWRSDLCQPAGIMHGGAIASLVDTAIANAILLTPQFLEAKARGGNLVSVDLRIKYLRPVSAGRIICEARVPRVGRQIIHASATVTHHEGKDVATGDSIYMLISGEQLRKRES